MLKDWRSIRAVLALTFKAVWQDLWTVLVVNSLWMLANLLIIPGPPATMALAWYTNQLAHEEPVDHTDYWRAIRRYFKAGWRWGIVNLFIILFLVGDYWLTYQAQDFTGKKLMLGLYVALLLFWLLLQFYTLPFLFEQAEFKLKLAWNNALVLIGLNLRFVIILGLVITLGLLLGTIAFLLSVFFGPVFIGMASNFAVLNRLENGKPLQIPSEG